MRLSYCFFSFVLFGLCGCGKPAEQSGTTDSVALPTETPAPIPQEAAPEQKAIAVITRTDAMVLSEPSLENAGVVSQPKVGQLVTVIESGPDLVVETYPIAESCDEYGYHYFKVSFEEEGQTTEGWIHGRSLHLMSPETTRDFQWVTYQQLQFEINLAVSDGIGPSNQDGLTGCDETMVVVIRNIETDRTYLVEARDDVFAGYSGLLGTTREGYLKLVSASEGGRTILNQWAVEECDGSPAVQLDLDESFQDGGASTTICMTWSEDGERLVVSSVRSAPL
jgi:hypothetical protein